MDDTDRPAFVTAFKRLVQTFRLKMRPAAIDDLAATYFHTLGSYPLPDVIAAGNQCLRVHRRFPKVADWLDLLTRSDVGAPPDIRMMSATEGSEYMRAERLRYEDDPCSCLQCQAAAVDRPLRFVPDVADDDRDEKAFCPPKNRIVVAGHWAHGDELVRWYAARDRFFGLAVQAGMHATVFRRFGFVYTPPSTTVREPGEEG